MRKLRALCAPALALCLVNCSDTPPPVSKPAIEKSVRDVEANMVKTFAAKDAAAFAANYTSDAVMMTPGQPPMKGAAAIRAGIGAMLADPALKLDFSSDRVEVADSGELAATRGNYSLTLTNPATKKVVTDKGSYVTVFRRQPDSTWKAVLDINTSEAPPPAPAAPAAKTTKKKKGKRR